MARRYLELPITRTGNASRAEAWVPRPEQPNCEYLDSAAETEVRTVFEAHSRKVCPAQPGLPCFLSVLRVDKFALRADQSWPRPREVILQERQTDCANSWLCGGFHN